MSELIGGQSGEEFTTAVPAEARIRALRVQAADYIDAIQVAYKEKQGDTAVLSQVGGSGGESYEWVLNEDEYLIGISGRVGWYVDSLRFHTNRRVSQTFGGSGGMNDFELMAEDGEEVVGFVGRAGDYLDAIGIMTRQVPRAKDAKSSVEKLSEVTPKKKPTMKGTANVDQPRVPTSDKKPKPKELKRIDGIGPKTADLLINNGILDLEDLAQTEVAQLEKILALAGRRYQLSNPASWTEQAALGAKGEWEALSELQVKLKGSRRKK